MKTVDELSQLEEISDTPVRQQNRKKRKNAVPRLVDQKRKHLERNMSSAQRDLLLINEAKEDAKFIDGNAFSCHVCATTRTNILSEYASRWQSFFTSA